MNIRFNHTNDQQKFELELAQDVRHCISAALMGSEPGEIMTRSNFEFLYDVIYSRILKDKLELNRLHEVSDAMYVELNQMRNSIMNTCRAASNRYILPPVISSRHLYSSESALIRYKNFCIDYQYELPIKNPL